MNHQQTQREREKQQRRDDGLRKAADAPARAVSIDIAGERAAILAAIRRPSETTERTILRLIDQARPKDLDLGVKV